MKRLLICTILRNQRHHVDRWMSQILQLRALVRDEYTVDLSCVENDSTDGTGEWLRNTAPMMEVDYKLPMKVTTETLGTTQYGSIWSVDRIRNLALARQKCLTQMGGATQLGQYSKVAYVEPDVTYSPEWISELVLARHPIAAGLGEPDVYSGWSLRTLSHPKESPYLYDTCATRATKDDLTWDVGENGDKWRGESLVRTDLGGVDSNCLHRVWSTFNCFCVYNARPFVEGAKWSWVNTRLRTGQAYIDDGDYGSGWCDADTAIMCETFRARGYDGVYLNTNCLVRHQ